MPPGCTIDCIVGMHLMFCPYFIKLTFSMPHCHMAMGHVAVLGVNENGDWQECA